MIKKILIFISLLLLGYGLVYYNDYRMKRDASKLIYSDISKVPAKRAGLLLGTTKYLSNGNINYYYKYRIEAAAKLFKAGKIRAIVVSGDNSTKHYDEPTSMKEDLVKLGVPAKYITLDYAGFRTLDSIVRAKAIFDLDDYTIISQRFHLERAIYLAHAKGQKVVGFEAKSFNNTYWKKRMEFRELLARAKAFLDVNILHKEPKFYGDKVKVEYKK